MTFNAGGSQIAQIKETAFRGDSIEFEVTVAKNGAPADLGQGHYWCTGKWYRDDDDAAALFQITEVDTPSGVITNPAPGILHVHLRPIASSTLPTGSPVQIDVQWQDPALDIWTVASGAIVFKGDVTRTTAPSSGAGVARLTAVAGDPFHRLLTYRDSTSALVDLTGSTATFTIRQGLNYPVALMLTESAGLTLGGLLGTISIDMTPTQTAALRAGLGAGGIYQLEVTFPGGIVVRVLEGDFVFV